MAEDLYAVLGVPKNADADTIKKAFRKLAAQLHPDKNPGNAKAEARFKLVNRANEVLSDPKKRKLYDEFGEDGLREGFDPERVRAYRQWSNRQGRGRPDSTYGGPGGTVDLEDLFGGAAGGAGGPPGGGFGDLFGDFMGRGRRPRGPARGPDLESEITIDFAAGLRGATLELRPQGQGGEPVTVRVPPGVGDGSRLRIAGQGAPSTSGGPRGDLLLTVRVTPHPFFRREGDDLHLDLPLTLAEAYHGAKVRVPTPENEVSLKVPPRTQSGQIVRLRGKGVAKKGKTTGDLYVHFLVRIPEDGGGEVAKLVDRLAEYQPDDPRRDIRL